MNIRKLATAIAVPLVVAFGLTACRSADAVDANGVVSLRYQGWTDQVLLPELAQALGYFKGKVKLDWVGNTISGPQDIQAAATGQTDFGGAFAGAVAKLESAGAPITAVINYYGSDAKTFAGFYVLDRSTIRTPHDLVGKKVGVNTLGGQDEADIHDYLRRAGLRESEVKKVQLVPLPPPNTLAALHQGQLDVAALSGQFQQQAVAQGGVRAVFTDTQEYGPFDGGPYVFRNDFISKHPAAVQAFTAGVARAIEWERAKPRATVIAEMTRIINARHRANENTSTLKYWLSVGVPTGYGALSDQDFTRWQSWLTDTGSVKGQLDAGKLYTNKFNPYVAKSGG